MGDKLEYIQERARALARSGRFDGFRSVAFKLQFEDGFLDAYQWIYSQSAQQELDRLCTEARQLHRNQRWWTTLRRRLSPRS
jgi:hypothetical protein